MLGRKGKLPLPVLFASVSVFLVCGLFFLHLQTQGHFRYPISLYLFSIARLAFTQLLELGIYGSLE